MALLNFPNTPANGQKFVDTAGNSWVYDSTNNSWTAEGFPKAGMVYKGSTDITQAPPSGAIAGWTMVSSTTGTANAGYGPSITGTVQQGSQIVYDGTKWDHMAPSLPDATTTSKGAVELATTAEVKAGTSGTVVITPAGAHATYAPLDSSTLTDGTAYASTDVLTVRRGTTNVRLTAQQLLDGVPHASESVRGIVELASSTETTTGTDTTRAVSPKHLKTELDKKVNLAGDTMTGVLKTVGVNSAEQTITATAFDLAKGNFWTCGAIAIPNPTNAVAAASGLIRLTAAPTGWGANFKHAGGAAPTIAAFPAIVPFYVQSSTVILVGKPVEGMA